MAITKDSFLQACTPKVHQLEVEGLDEPLVIRVLTGSELDRLESAIADPSDPLRKNMRCTIAAWVIVDDDGKRMFSDADLDQVGGLSGGVLQAVMDAALDHSGLTSDDIDSVS